MSFGKRIEANMKGYICLLTYWALFIIAPLTFILFLVPSNWKIGTAVISLIILVMIGEHGFRKWKKLWDVQ